MMLGQPSFLVLESLLEAGWDEGEAHPRDRDTGGRNIGEHSNTSMNNAAGGSHVGQDLASPNN